MSPADTTHDTIRRLTSHYLPEARWTVGGAFRFGKNVGTILRFLTQLPGLEHLQQMAGVVPCAWSLDWFEQRRPILPIDYTEQLEAYIRINMGITLVFDNPCITDEALNDVYGAFLLRELAERNRLDRNAVCVASDKLAAHIRALHPNLPIYCHANRLVAERGRRTPDLYNKLATQYDRVCLHPADAVKPALIGAIKQPEKFDVIINDPCLRKCPVRREHMQLLADMRRNPYQIELRQMKASLVQRARCQCVDKQNLQQQAACNLSREEAQALYHAGFRSFIIQSQAFRNEVTLLWDIFHCLLNHTPEQCNKMAVIAHGAIAECAKEIPQLPGGLRDFSFSR